MRILLCCLDYYPTAIGGAARQAQLQAEELTRRGHQITVVCPGFSGSSSEVVNGVFVCRLAPIWTRRWFDRLSWKIYFARLAVYLTRQLRRFDVVHVLNAYNQANLIVLVGLILRRPVYIKVIGGGSSGDVTRARGIMEWTRYFGLRHATLVQALSAEIETELRRAGVQSHRIVALPNGVDCASYKPPDAQSRAAIRQNLGLPVDKLIFLFAGRLIVGKGIDDLLAAWMAAGPPEGSLLVLLGAGAPGELKVDLDQSANVVVRPWTADVAPYYQASDVFVLPSHAEGMSNALLEAMATGLAVVATRVGAAESMIVDHANGLLINAGDREALASRLTLLAADGRMRAQLGYAALELVRDRYSIESVVDRLESAYERIRKTPKPS